MIALWRMRPVRKFAITKCSVQISPEFIIRRRTRASIFVLADSPTEKEGDSSKFKLGSEFFKFGTLFLLKIKRRSLVVNQASGVGTSNEFKIFTFFICSRKNTLRNSVTLEFGAKKT